MLRPWLLRSLSKQPRLPQVLAQVVASSARRSKFSERVLVEAHSREWLRLPQLLLLLWMRLLPWLLLVGLLRLLLLLRGPLRLLLLLLRLLLRRLLVQYLRVLLRLLFLLGLLWLLSLLWLLRCNRRCWRLQRGECRRGCFSSCSGPPPLRRFAHAAEAARRLLVQVEPAVGTLAARRHAAGDWCVAVVGARALAGPASSAATTVGPLLGCHGAQWCVHKVAQVA